MNWRRYFVALAITSVLTLIVDVVLNAVIFRDVFKRSADLLLPASQLNARVPLGWGALLVIVAAFGLLLARSEFRGVRGGLLFGLILGGAGLAGVAGMASIVAWPAELLCVMAVQQFVNGILLGLVFGRVYVPRTAA